MPKFSGRAHPQTPLVDTLGYSNSHLLPGYFNFFENTGSNNDIFNLYLPSQIIKIAFWQEPLGTQLQYTWISSLWATVLSKVSHWSFLRNK